MKALTEKGDCFSDFLMSSEDLKEGKTITACANIKTSQRERERERDAGLTRPAVPHSLLMYIYQIPLREDCAEIWETSALVQQLLPSDN